MFNTFYKGTVDDLLAFVGTAPNEEIAKVGNENEVLNREELIAYIMDTAKCPREEAVRVADEIQLEEFDKTIKPLLEKGFVEIVEYDKDGQPVYKPTLKGLMAFSTSNN
jgi:HD superfamily phosphohydrolase YqeK